MIIKPGDPQERLYYHYNQRNLLVLTEEQQGTGPTLPVAEFVYDGDANRLQHIDHTSNPTITTTYTNDILGLSQVLVSNDGATTTTNLFGLDLISQDNGNETRTLLGDGLGSTRIEMVVDFAGSAVIQTTTTYEPYGKLLAQTGLSGTTYGFTGEQYDALTSLVYLRARYYNPSLKLFMSRDPFPGWMTVPATQHPYGYVGNNPVNRTDPSGNCFFFGIDTLICLGAGLAFGVSVGAQTIHNMQQGMSFLDAIYHENIDWKPVAASTLAGGITGVLGGTLLPFVATEVSLLFGTGSVSGYGATILASMGYGAAINVSGSRIGEILANALWGCDPFLIENRGEYEKLAIIGAITAGLATGVDQGARSATRVAYQGVRNDVHNEAWDAVQRAGIAYPSANHPFWSNIEIEISRRTSLILQEYYSMSTAISVGFNSDVWKAFFESMDFSENNLESGRL